MGLSIKLNDANRAASTGEAFNPRTAVVAATWEDLQEFAPVARKTISRALSRLEEVGAVKRQLVGRANHYHLQGLEENGGWCQLPQSHLAFGGKPLGQLDGLLPNRHGLAALKLFVLLLAFRDWKKNTTVISYTKINERSGVLRGDIRQALAALSTADLIRQVDATHSVFEDGRYNVYQVRGLSGQLQPNAVQFDV